MKTHTARWFRNSPSTWILKARAQDGGAVLATVREITDEGWTWRSGARYGVEASRQQAQRAVRAALAQGGVGE